MSVRPARSDDAPAVRAIVNHVIETSLVSFKQQPLPLAEIAGMIGSRPVFVAEAEGILVGYASYGQFRGGTGYARTMEHSIALAPEARGLGHGRALMSAVEAHARAAGAGSLWAGVSAANPEGRWFHAALGYEQIAVLPAVGFKWGRWLDLVLMRKWLATDEGRADNPAATE